MSLFVSVVFRHVVEAVDLRVSCQLSDRLVSILHALISAQDNGSRHLGLGDNAGHDTSTDRHLTGERALLVDAV